MILQKINPNQISLGCSYVKYLSSRENKNQLTGLAVNPVTYVFELNVDLFIYQISNSTMSNKKHYLWVEKTPTPHGGKCVSWSELRLHGFYPRIYPYSVHDHRFK